MPTLRPLRPLCKYITESFSSLSKPKYDVFLASGGGDTANFRSNLNYALNQWEINTFLSQERDDEQRRIDELLLQKWRDDKQRFEEQQRIEKQRRMRQRRIKMRQWRIEKQQRIDEQWLIDELLRIKKRKNDDWRRIEKRKNDELLRMEKRIDELPRIMQDAINVMNLKGKERSREGSISETWKAIENSRISTVIFSKEYSSSTWCLNELVKIVKCKEKFGQIIVPVFYNVDRSEVRNQTGPFKEAFAKHEKLEDPDKVRRWRAALRAVADLPEFHLNDRPESELIQEIVEDIQRKLRPTLSVTTTGLGEMDLKVGKLRFHFGLGLKEVPLLGFIPKYKYGTYLPSPPSYPKLEYDVFLSFRGDDTRNNFTYDLFNALVCGGLSTFIDENLDKGEEIGPELMKAIEGSRSSVVILSKEYASSTWCLDELVKILNCKKKHRLMVVPVFFDVDPSEVRNQTGHFKKAFTEFEKVFKEKPEKVKKWRAAMRDVGNINGFHLKKGSQVKLIQDIVKYIKGKLSRTSSNSIKELGKMDLNLGKLDLWIRLGWENGKDGVDENILVLLLFLWISLNWIFHNDFKIILHTDSVVLVAGILVIHKKHIGKQ